MISPCQIKAVRGAKSYKSIRYFQSQLAFPYMASRSIRLKLVHAYDTFYQITLEITAFVIVTIMLAM